MAPSLHGIVVKLKYRPTNKVFGMRIDGSSGELGDLLKNPGSAVPMEPIRGINCNKIAIRE
jgi:hypothetical protein